MNRVYIFIQGILKFVANHERVSKYEQTSTILDQCRQEFLSYFDQVFIELDKLIQKAEGKDFYSYVLKELPIMSGRVARVHASMYKGILLMLFFSFFFSFFFQKKETNENLTFYSFDFRIELDSKSIKKHLNNLQESVEEK